MIEERGEAGPSSGWGPWARSALTGALAILVALIVWLLGSRIASVREKEVVLRQHRAEAALRAGRFDDAVRDFEAIALEHPEAPGNWAQLGNALLQGRRHEEAARAFAEGLSRLDSDGSSGEAGPLHYNLAFALAHLRQYRMASDELRAAARAAPSVSATVDYHALTGVVLAGRGRSDSARAAFDRAASISREDTLAFIQAWLAEEPNSNEAPLLREIATGLGRSAASRLPETG